MYIDSGKFTLSIYLHDTGVFSNHQKGLTTKVCFAIEKRLVLSQCYSHLRNFTAITLIAKRYDSAIHSEFKTPYRISSNKTRRYYFFRRPSTAGIVRTRVLIEGWYYYQTFINLDINTRKPANPKVFIIKIARFLRGVIKIST